MSHSCRTEKFLVFDQAVGGDDQPLEPIKRLPDRGSVKREVLAVDDACSHAVYLRLRAGLRGRSGRAHPIRNGFYSIINSTFCCWCPVLIQRAVIAPMSKKIAAVV